MKRLWRVVWQIKHGDGLIRPYTLPPAESCNIQSLLAKLAGNSPRVIGGNGDEIVGIQVEEVTEQEEQRRHVHDACAHARRVTGGDWKP